MERLQSNYQFSINANASLKADYDLLQEKLEKQMKTSNNIIIDCKEDIQALTQRKTILENFKEEQEEKQAKEEEKQKKMM